MLMTKSEGEQLRQGFEISTNIKSIKMFGLRDVSKPIKSDRNIVRLTKLLILSIKPRIKFLYYVFLYILRYFLAHLRAIVFPSANIINISAIIVGIRTNILVG